MQSRVSVAELIDNDVPLRPDEAAAIVRDVCRQYAAGSLRGIPNPTVIRLTPDGAVVVEGPVSRDQSAVPAAAALLNELLPPFDSPTGFKVPGGLRLVLARATRTLDLPPFANADEFSAALERFAAADLSGTVRGLYAAWAARGSDRVESPSKELTISDVRRARRATGLTLEDVSRASAIPAGKLRELEWGYLRNWHGDGEGRDELRRYARAAGLDEDLVVSVAWPLIENDSDGEDAAEPFPAALPPPRTWALVPAGPQMLAPSSPAAAKRRPHPLLQYRWAFALVAAILLVAGVVSTGWEQTLPPPPHVARALVPQASQPAPRVLDATDPIDGVRPASYTRAPAIERAADRPVPARPSAAARPRVRKPPAPTKRESRPAHQSFFKRELFRIVIR